MDTQHTVAWTEDHQTLNGYVDHLQYLRPLLWGLRITGMLTWLEKDVRDSIHAKRWKLLLLMWVLRVLHAIAIFITIFFVNYQKKVRDVAGIVAHSINLGLPLTSIYFLVVICYKSPTLARLCGRLVDLDFFFLNWQRGNSSSQVVKMRRPNIFLTDPIALLLTLLFFLGLVYQFLIYRESSPTQIMIGFPILFLTNIASVSMFLVILLYRVLTKLLGYEIRRFLLAALEEDTALSSITNSSMTKSISEKGDLLFSFSSHERPAANVILNEENKEEDEDDKEHRQSCPMEVYLLGEAFFRVSILRVTDSLTD